MNGEAIYASRPWVVSGEGDTKGTSGYMTDNQKTEYTAQDIRFTTRGEALYAISLSWTDGKITIRNLAKGNANIPEIKYVYMLGCNETLQWEQTSNGLEVQFPQNAPTDYAHVLKIEYK